MQLGTCDQIMTPAKKESVCIISFSGFRPARVTNSPDLCMINTLITKYLIRSKKAHICQCIISSIYYHPEPRQKPIV
jgi:hypothetical protein